MEQQQISWQQAVAWLGGEQISISPEQMAQVEQCYEFLRDFANEKVIYGINTGFGPMAQWRVSDEHLKELQFNIIRSHATGMGEPLSDLQVRAAMIVRLGTLLQARSGVHPDTIRLLVGMLNCGIYPRIPRHGSVGASGDLVQLAHLALAMIGEGQAHLGGEWMPAAEALQKCGLQPLKIHIREGLSLTNGTSVMTGIALVNQLQAERLLGAAVLASVWMNEIAASYDDWMAEPLNAVRRHPGQQRVAQMMRRLAQGSQRLVKREHALYNGPHTEATFEHKVQAYYSLRCTPQILGPIDDALTQSRTLIEEEINSACDNPIIDPLNRNVWHGGNFHGDYISLEQDKVKIALVRLTMTAERQLNYLLHHRINDILPPFLNRGTLGLNYGLQASQFTATSTTAECQTLAMPNYVHSIPNNHDNQDIVSMGTNTALLTQQVIDNAFQVLSIHFVALAQATDCLAIAPMLAPATRRAYELVRKLSPELIADRPLTPELQAVEQLLRQGIPLTNDLEQA